MTDEQTQAQALDLEDRRRQAEEALEVVFRCVEELEGFMDDEYIDGVYENLAICASEMGISDFYRKLKEGK